MSSTVQVFPGPALPAEVTGDLVALLKRHLPYSLPLLRRIQFTRFAGGVTEYTRVLFASSGTPLGKESSSVTPASSGERAFAAAYVDFSRGPETEVWMYSSLESRVVREHDGGDGDGDSGRNVEEVDLALSLLREVKRQRDAYVSDPATVPRERKEVLMGTLGERLRLALVERSGDGVRNVVFPYVSLYDKWLMRVGELPEIGERVSSMMREESEDGEGLHWTRVRREDIQMVLSRSDIPRRERTIVLLPSMAVAKKDGTLIAWAFLGPDSSLSSLHCEPEYRGRGLARAVAIKIFKEHLGKYGDDGYCWADVAPENMASQGVCKSLGAKPAWQDSWSTIDLDESFPDA